MTNAKTTIVPSDMSAEELQAIPGIIRYAVEGFDLASWYTKFFDDSEKELVSDSLLPKAIRNMLYADRVKAGKPFLDPSAPPLALIVRDRAAAMRFPITDAACMFIGMFCATPGQAVMHVVAAACSWQYYLYLKANTSEQCEFTQYTVPDTEWFLSSCGLAEPTDDGRSDMYNTSALLLPKQKHLRKMWELQKVEGTNAFDRICTVSPDGELKRL